MAGEERHDACLDAACTLSFDNAPSYFVTLSLPNCLRAATRITALPSVGFGFCTFKVRRMLAFFFFRSFATLRCVWACAAARCLLGWLECVCEKNSYFMDFYMDFWGG